MPCSPNVAALHLRAEENGTKPVRVQESVLGNAAAMALSVALRSSSAASAPSAASTGAWSSSRSTRSNTMFPSVERAGLVEADDVDPGEPLDGRELLDEHLASGQRDRGDPEGDARQQHEALGHHADDRRPPCR